MSWIEIIVNLVPKYLSLLLTWPVLGFILGIIFITKFSENIKKFLSENRVKKVGGVEFEEQQKPEDPIAEELEEKNEEKRQELDSKLSELTTEIENKDKIIEINKQIAEANRFAYLNLFFVVTTKMVLKWFYDSKNSLITKDVYNTTYSQVILDVAQREVILDVLKTNGMIVEENFIYKITNDGEKFLRYIKWII
jgi:hypothetical protein